MPFRVTTLTLQGHVTSQVTWPIDSPYVISYRCLFDHFRYIRLPKPVRAHRKTDTHTQRHSTLQVVFIICPIQCIALDRQWHFSRNAGICFHIVTHVLVCCDCYRKMVTSRVCNTSNILHVTRSTSTLMNTIERSLVGGGDKILTRRYVIAIFAFAPYNCMQPADNLLLTSSVNVYIRLSCSTTVYVIF